MLEDGRISLASTEPTLQGYAGPFASEDIGLRVEGLEGFRDCGLGFRVTLLVLWSAGPSQGVGRQSR